MHDYSIDRHPKEYVLFLLAFAAISVAPALNRWISELAELLGAATGWTWGPVTAIPVFGLFSLLYMLFNKKLWKVEAFRKGLLVPDLNGTWTCSGTTILRNGERVNTPWQGEITITQSWSKLAIHLKTGQSSSQSVSASVSHEPGVGYRLLYQYSNRPKADQLDLSRHGGASELLFSENCRSAEGSYFTDQHRKTVGTMSLRKR
jgi:hypothetical protein